MNLPIRVLQILTKLSYGGVQSMIMNYYRSINKGKVQFDFVVQDQEEGFYEQEVLKLGGKIYKVAPMNLNLKKFEKDLLEILKNNPDYKIIHVHQNFLNIIPLRVSKKEKLPVRISHSHSNYPASSFIKELQRTFFRLVISVYATDYFACSFASAIWLYGRKNVRSSKCRIVHNAIETNKFVLDSNIRNKIRRDLNIDDNLVLINVGTFADGKNHEYLFKIYREVLKNNKNSSLLLVGDGNKKDNLIQLAIDYGINKNTFFLGLKDNVNEYLMAADYFVLPSKFEGLPLVAIEAQISGLPCLMSDVITNEINLFGDVTFKSITSPPEEWANFILEANIPRHTKTFEEIKKSGYEIKYAANELEQFYLKSN